MYKKILLFCFLFLLNQKLFSQTSQLDYAQKEIIKINEVYGKLQKLSMQISYSLFNSHTANTALSTSKGMYKKAGKNYYSEMLGVKTIQNNQYKIVVDSTNKIISINTPEVIKGAEMVDVISSALKTCSNAKLISYKNSTELKLYFNKTYDQYKEIDIVYDSKSYLMQKIVLYYNQPVNLNLDAELLSDQTPRIEIVYSNVSTTAKINSSVLDEKKYFYKHLRGYYVPSEGYKSYRIVDQRLN